MRDATAVSTTEGSSFEAMFVRSLSPKGAFLEELQRAGFDPARMQPRYPTELWHRCLEIARKHVHPDLKPEQGMRELGTLFMKGYYATIIGKVVSAAMPLLGLERTLARVPRAWQASQPTLGFDLEKEAPGQWRIVLREPGIIPDFCAGMLEAGAEPVGVPVKVEVLERGPLHCVLRLTG